MDRKGIVFPASSQSVYEYLETYQLFFVFGVSQVYMGERAIRILNKN